jgi:hypothetical protein
MKKKRVRPAIEELDKKYIVLSAQLQLPVRSGIIPPARRRKQKIQTERKLRKRDREIDR